MAQRGNAFGIGYSQQRALLTIGASLTAIAAASSPAYAQQATCVTDGPNSCTITNTGTTGAIVLPPNRVRIDNSGTISGATAISSTQRGILLLTNRVGGTITGTSGTAINLAGNQTNPTTPGSNTILSTFLGSVIVNQGTINGNVRTADAAPRTIFVQAGGTLNGNLDLGSTFNNNPIGTSATFLYRGANTGVTGTITAGNGIDFYGRSITASGLVTLGDPLPTSFEVAAVEASGLDTTATLIATPGRTTPVEGVILYGNGSVVNRANITTYSIAGSGLPAANAATLTAIGQGGNLTQPNAVTLVTPGPTAAVQRQVFLGSGLRSFSNEAVVTGDVRLTTASFTNNGQIIGQSSNLGTSLTANLQEAFSFTNSATGLIRLVDAGARPTIISNFGVPTVAVTIRSPFASEDAQAYTITNAGRIEGGIAGGITASDFTFTNSGTITQFNAANPAVAFLVGTDVDLDQSTLDATNVSLTNSGTITGGIGGEFAVVGNFSFLNTGSISGFRESQEGTNRAVDISLDTLGGDDEETTPDPDTAQATIENRGTITGTVRADGNVTALTFANSGTITADGSDGDAAVDIENDSNFAQTATITNAANGRITQTGLGGNGLRYEGETDTGKATVTIANAGIIESNAGGVVTQRQPNNPNQPRFDIDFAIALGVPMQGATGSEVTLTNAAGATISASGSLKNADGSVAPNARAGAGSLAVGVLADTFTLVNDGTITGGTGTNLPAGIVFGTDFEDGPLATATYIAGAIQTGAGVDTIRNNGTITGSIALGAGNDRIENYGTLTGDVFLGDGDDVFVQGIRATYTGAADGGTGTNRLQLDTTGGGTINLDQFKQFTNFNAVEITGDGQVSQVSGSSGSDTVQVDQGTNVQTVALGEGDNNFTNQGNVQGDATSGSGNDTVANNGTVGGNVDAGAGNNNVQNSGTVQGNVVAAGGDDRVTNSGTVQGNVNAGDGTNIVQNSGTVGGSVIAGTGNDQIGNTGTIAGGINAGAGNNVIRNGAAPVQAQGIRTLAFATPLAVATPTVQGAITAGAGDDTITNDGIAAGGIDAGDGNNSITNNVGARVDLGIRAGAGNDTIVNNGAISGGVAAGAGANSIRNNAGATIVGGVTGGAGIDTIVNAGTIDTIAAGDGANVITNSGSVTGAISTGAGADTVTNSGAIAGVSLGAGDDRFVLAATGTFSGTLAGDAGTDTLNVSFAGTAAAPTTLAVNRITGFETLEVAAGVGSIAANTTAAFTTIQLNAGRLVGQAGSTITAPTINVANGATFGSAGTVNGNIAVAGTLSPGASPGTMTVNGNVSLAANSTTLFELTPTVSDQLLISGTLTVASGAALNLTGNRPLTPGAALDLIVANGGITGSFAITKDPAIFGFISQTANRIQLLGTFANTGFNPQVTATINYVNAALTGGQASAGLLAAVPTLNTAGATNAAAFAQLNPEAYASASQIGTEHGLALAKAGRTAAYSTRTEAGLFTFAQALGNWRKLGGSAAVGTSRANIDSYGFLGGIGTGSDSGSIGAFVGYLNSRQRIGALGARNHADGLVAGLNARIAAGGFDLAATLAYDDSSAGTRRALPGTAATATSRYKLHSWIADGSVGYAIPLGTAWALKPQAGLTYVSTKRGATAETGGGAFALTVARRSSDATFIDGALSLTGGIDSGAAFHPWLSAGVRHQLSGEGSLATAAFTGSGGAFTVAGVTRDQTLATVGAGFSADLGKGLALFGAYQAEFGGGEAHNISGGLRFRF